MRIPFYLLTVATGVALFLPVATAAQSYATMPLSTRSADAAAEFRLGVTDALMSNPPPKLKNESAWSREYADRLTVVDPMAVCQMPAI